MENNNIKISNTKYTLKQSPHYEEQKDEIEILNNIIPDRLIIESDDPNYILDIKVQSSLDSPEKEYKLKIYLNYFYPEKSPRFEFYEVNDFLQEYRKKEAISRLNKCLEENKGFTTLYQLYECAVEFADEEEERRAKILENYKKQLEKTRFPLNQMKIYKKFDDIYITDVVVLKNNYLLLASCENKFSPYLRIIDECYEKQIYELNLINNSENKKYQFEIKKMILYKISNTEEDLFILCSDKNIRIFRINYLKAKSKKTGINLSIEYTSKVSFIDFKDLLFLNDYNCFLFLCKESIIFWKYNDKYLFNEDSKIKEIPINNSEIEIFYLNKNLFALPSSTQNKISFLHFEGNNLGQYRWGKKVKIACSQKNYLIQINAKNILFGNNILTELIIIYIPTGEIVSRYEWNIISSIHKINDSIYLSYPYYEGIDEIDFKKGYLREFENNNNNKMGFNRIHLIKPIEKGYFCFAKFWSFMICK